MNHEFSSEANIEESAMAFACLNPGVARSHCFTKKSFLGSVAYYRLVFNLGCVG